MNKFRFAKIGDVWQESKIRRDPKTGKFLPKNQSGEAKETETAEPSDSGYGYKAGWETAIKPENHKTFKALTECKVPASLVANEKKLQKYKTTIETAAEDFPNSLDMKPDSTLLSLDFLHDGRENPLNLLSSKNLDPIGQFLYNFCQNSDGAKILYEKKGKLKEYTEQIKKMIEYSPEIKGEVWRAERLGRVDIGVGNTVNFDMRSSADDDMGYEVTRNFMQDDFEAGDDIVYFKFPKGIRGLNIQGVSPYINEHEYLIDGDFVMVGVEEDEWGCKIVELDFLHRK